MGYYTYYNLGIDPSTEYSDELDISKHKEAIEDTYGGASFEEPVKWYSHERDMGEYSKKYPDIIFTLEGDGEDSDDMWKAYYRNGKSYYVKPKIVYPDYNENLLE